MSPVVIVLVIVGVVVLLIVGAVGVMAALGIYGARRYISEAKASEGKLTASALARGIVACSEKNRVSGSDLLPPTSQPVPPSLADVSGKKYMSDPSEWKDAAYDCASFSMSSPQYFQYQWVKNGADRGVVRAIADFDGNGSEDATFEVEVTCTPASCSAGTLQQK